MNDKNEVLEIKREFNLGDTGYFFASNSLETFIGKVVGFYYTYEYSEVDGKQVETPVLWYQLSFVKENSKGEEKTYFATIPSSEISLTAESIEEKFSPLRKQRLTNAIEKEKKNKEGMEVEKKVVEEGIVEINKELSNLLEEYSKRYGEYKPS